MIINLFPNVHLLFTDCILVIKQMKNLMCIHADDYGYSQNISKDILFCIDNGLVNSVSVMIHADEKSLDNLIEKKLLNISLHLNLTSLNLDQRYENYHQLNNLNFVKLFFAGKKTKQISKKEIEFQISKFKDKFKDKKLIIDGHHHIQVIPWIFKILKNQYEDVQIRIPNEKIFLFSYKFLFNLIFWRNLFALIILKILSINKNKFSVKNFAGLLYSGIYNKSTLIKHIRKMIKRDVSFEITFHPGSGCISEKNIFKKSHFKYVTSPMRKKELNLLTTTELDNIF